MKIPQGGIAFFDSGIGGLTVLEECRKRLPQENLYYYGDNLRAPYGNLSLETIRSYVSSAFELFLTLRVKAAVIACNTVTAVCAEELRAKYPFPIIGAEPAILSAARRGGRVFVLTTRATYQSNRFQALCQKASARFPSAEIFAFPCDALAGEIERRLSDKSYDFTQFLPKGKADAVVLGCTHYIYIKETIQNFYGCEVYDGNQGIAKRLQSVLSSDKRWDERPLFYNGDAKIGESAPESPHLTTEEKTQQNTNVCLCEKSEKTTKNDLKQGGGEIFFLGNGKKINKNIYEQMFVLD